MFAFRQTNPKRKISHSNKAENSKNNAKTRGGGGGPLKLFGQNTPPVHNVDDDNCSVDMSLYTTQSKATIRYATSHGDHEWQSATSHSDNECQSHAPTEFTTEIALARYSKLGGAGVSKKKPQAMGHSSLLTPATQPIRTPFEDDFSLASSSYDVLQQKQPRFSFEQGELPATARTTARITQILASTPVDLSPIKSPTPTKPKRILSSSFNRSSSPVDLDESVVDTSSIASSSNSWVMSSSGMASPAVYLGNKASFVDDDSSSFSSRYHESHRQSSSPQQSRLESEEILSIMSPRLESEEIFSIMSPQSIVQLEDDDDQEESPFVWTDNEEDEEDDREAQQTQQHQWNDDDDSILDRTYKETMDSISTSKRLSSRKSDVPTWVEQDDDPSSPGAVLLTEDELKRHMHIVQNAQPMPSSDIQGYDSWKRQKEYQKRYFAKLQQNANARRRQRVDRRQPQQTLRSVPNIDRQQPYELRSQSLEQEAFVKPWSGGNMMDSTRSAMDQSVDSSIPTLDDGLPKPRRKKEEPSPPKRRWSLLPMFRSPKKDKKKKKKGTSSSKSKRNKSRSSPDKKKKEKKPIKQAVVPLAHFMRISSDEPSDVAALSLSPMNKMGHMTLGSSAPEIGDTLAATRSHQMDNDSYGGPKQLAFKYLEEERQKQRQADLDRSRDEHSDQERIQRMKQQELERQRRMNLSYDRPPRQSKPTKAWESNRKSANSTHSKPHKPQYPTQEVKSRKDTDSTHSPSEDSMLDKSLSICSKQSTSSSLQSHSAGSNTVLSPCVVCNAAERTHLAMPCMHYYFCESCVESLYDSDNPTCPVCKAENVAFSRVFVG